MDYFSYLYEKPELLNYLRYHPEWYKILYYEPQRFKEFLDEAKENLKITLNDKIEDYKSKLGLITGLLDYIRK